MSPERIARQATIFKDGNEVATCQIEIADGVPYLADDSVTPPQPDGEYEVRDGADRYASTRNNDVWHGKLIKL